MKRTAFFILLMALSGFGVQSFAQMSANRIPTRSDDHFQRWRVVSRLNMEEKLNFPLIRAINSSIYDKEDLNNNAGIVAALIQGLKDGRYLAHNPDNLKETFTWEEVEAIHSKLCGTDEDIDSWEIEEPEDEFVIEEEFPEEGDYDVFPATESEFLSASEEFDITAYESVIEIIEDRIMDKNRSEMVYDLKYIRLVWVDPAETLPDQYFITLKYDDVAQLLEDTRWVNTHNDAEDRNLKEIMELRLFNSYPINVSGRGVKHMEETYFRDQQMVNFEHNLWSF